MTGIHRSNPTATVIDTRPGEVRVRLGDNAELPRWYPSVLVATPVSTVGTMLRKNQEDMVFVPEGVDLSVVGHTHDSRYYSQAEVNALMQAWRTRTGGGYSGSFALFDSAGTTPFGPEAVFTGLDPSGTYSLVSTAGWRVTSTTGQGGAGFWLTHAGAPTGEYVAWHSTINCNGMSNHPVSLTRVDVLSPLPSGEIRTQGAFSWTSGSIYVNTSRIVATLTRVS